ncbi:hypothetical protein ASPZODRAFT_150759 [Penicilliopsis zonata CBS 506.65]|uniref:NADP-dependent oxidoreductase domain-containing protein n=1 Tax=Penicilliopsis zonata CBS 506.65 TaxID=1073090 RepID=A0A1L9SNE0_9EURO|nr:hypothetical protein ASPZODRAFT_150759 [Penicilliopsis zonata CBS 506.65]OJJ48557.1 hypothetical protein ASPZODRAFT_150759 [Penicilliopsis zonata CBS 506.65]
MMDVIFGAGSIGYTGRDSPEDVVQILDLLRREGVSRIDTAQGYGASEELLGKAGVVARGFSIDTKYSGVMSPTPSSREGLIAAAEESLRKLNASKVDVYYLHSPDERASLEDLLAGIDELYRRGAFARFGLSNFTGEGVEAVIRIASEKGYVLPSVFQGNYSAVCRRVETEVMPVLRKHHIPFIAYSPNAGGFLTKSPEEILGGQTGGRWQSGTRLGSMYHALFTTEGMLRFLREWSQIADEAGIPKAELAYRWVVFNSCLREEYGDAIIFGARNLHQLEETLAAIKKGPLAQREQDRIQALWKDAEEDSFLDNYNSYIKFHL